MLHGTILAARLSQHFYLVAVLCALQSWARALYGCNRRIHAQPRVRRTHISVLVCTWIALTRKSSWLSMATPIDWYAGTCAPGHRFEVEDAPVGRMDKRLDIRTCYDFVLKSVKCSFYCVDVNLFFPRWTYTQSDTISKYPWLGGSCFSDANTLFRCRDHISCGQTKLEDIHG